MQSFDPLNLQRLVDGELDRDETRKMLELAETNPELWRAMASAFAENQLWESGFRKLELGIEPESNKTTPAKPTRNGMPHANRIHWLALVACMMVALTVGLLIGRLDNGPGNSIAQLGAVASPADDLLADTVPALPETSTPGHTLVNYRPDYRLELEDQYGNPVFDTEVPLYNLATAQKAGYQFDRKPTLPTELVDRAVKRGYWLDQNVNYVSGRLDDGRMFVVPVRTIDLVSGL